MSLNRTTFHAWSLCVCLLFLVPAPPAAAQGAPHAVSLQSVKDLYASAAYEEALTAVGKLDDESPNFEAEQYRVFCLVALNRLDEAEKAVEAILVARPEFHADSAEASPRIQGLFKKVRRRIGPALVKQMYHQGKAAMDRKERDQAIAQFEAMLRIANDPDVRNEEHIAELKELGSGFLELTRAIPARPVPPPPVEAAAEPARPSVIVPPVVIRQQLPGWVPDPVNRATEFNGAVRVQISAEGKVVEAEMTKSVHPAYDQLVLRAARGWLYQPARKDGIPISSEKIIQIAVTPARQASPADKSLLF